MADIGIADVKNKCQNVSKQNAQNHVLVMSAVERFKLNLNLIYILMHPISILLIDENASINKYNKYNNNYSIVLFS